MKSACAAKYVDESPCFCYRIRPHHAGAVCRGGDRGRLSLGGRGRLSSSIFSPRRRRLKAMAKTIAKLLGVVFILVGIVGFIMPGFLGTHLSLTHNLVHIISGAVALYFGFSRSLSRAKMF